MVRNMEGHNRYRYQETLIKEAKDATKIHRSDTITSTLYNNLKFNMIQQHPYFKKFAQASTPTGIRILRAVSHVIQSMFFHL